MTLEPASQPPSATRSKRVSRPRWNGDTGKSVSATPPKTCSRTSILGGLADFSGFVGGLARFLRLPTPLHRHRNRRRTRDPVSNGQCLLPLSRMESESLCRIRCWSLLPRWGRHLHHHRWERTRKHRRSLHRAPSRSPHEHRNVRGFPVFLSDHGRPLGLRSPGWWSSALAIAFAPVEGQSSIPTRLRAASGSGSDANLSNGAPRYFCSRGSRGRCQWHSKTAYCCADTESARGGRQDRRSAFCSGRRERSNRRRTICDSEWRVRTSAWPPAPGNPLVATPRCSQSYQSPPRPLRFPPSVYRL